METITIPKKEYEHMKKLLQILESDKKVNPNLYEELKHLPKKEWKEARTRLLRKRLAEFEDNIKNGKKYYREDLRF